MGRGRFRSCGHGFGTLTVSKTKYGCRQGVGWTKRGFFTELHLFYVINSGDPSTLPSRPPRTARPPGDVRDIPLHAPRLPEVRSLYIPHARGQLARGCRHPTTPLPCRAPNSPPRPPETFPRGPKFVGRCFMGEWCVWSCRAG